ncbi:eamA-like transporter family protein, partial [Vibrio parahaemolyticus V-223/04]
KAMCLACSLRVRLALAWHFCRRYFGRVTGFSTPKTKPIRWWVFCWAFWSPSHSLSR